MSNVQSVIAEFSAKLEAAIRTDALEQITARLTGAAAPAAKPAAKSNQLEGRGIVVLAKPVKPKKASAKKGSPKKRTPEELEKTTSAVRRVIDAGKGVSAEQIKKELGVELPEIQLPIAKLLEAKLIKKTGQKRATRYFTR